MFRKSSSDQQLDLRLAFLTVSGTSPVVGLLLSI
jgi:hypothetical protein